MLVVNLRAVSAMFDSSAWIEARAVLPPARAFIKTARSLKKKEQKCVLCSAVRKVLSSAKLAHDIQAQTCAVADVLRM